MRDSFTFGLFESSLNLREEIKTFHRIFDGSIIRKFLNQSDDLSLRLRDFHDLPHSTTVNSTETVISRQYIVRTNLSGLSDSRALHIDLSSTASAHMIHWW